MDFQQEQFSNFFSEAIDLFNDHHHEVGDYFPNDKDIKFDPNVEAFLKLDAAGMLKVYTIRIEGELVGYCIHHVYNHLHYRNSLQSVQDALFIAKEHRGIGKKFISWVDDRLKSEGVDAVYHYVSIHCDYSNALLDLNYFKIEDTYLRRLH